MPTAAKIGVAITGLSTTVAPAGTIVFACLYDGTAEVGNRIAFSTTAVPGFTPVTANGTHSIRIYTAATGGSLLASTAVFSVAAAATPAIESIEATSVTTVGPTITDAAGVVYSINTAGQVVTNGAGDPNTSSVVQLYYHLHQLYQQNAPGDWYTRTSATAPYVQTTSPVPVVVGPGSGTPTSTTGTQALSADAMVDSIGVNTHWDAYPTGWATYDNNYQAIRTLFLASGIRHMRQSIDPLTTGYTTLMKDFAANGVKFCFLYAQNGAAVPDYWGTPAQQLAYVAANFTGAQVTAFEGINEPDNNMNPAPPGTWQAWTVARQTELFNAVRSYSQFATTPVLSSGLTQVGSAQLLATAGVNAYCTNTNIHNYQGQSNPETTQSPYSLDANRTNMAAPISSSKAMWSTENGYTTGAFAASQGIPIDVHAKYIPRLILNSFSYGIVKSYLYEMIDQGTDTGRESNFGLIYNNATARPAMAALSNLVKLCADPGASFTPNKLNYTLGGNTTNVKVVLLGKRDNSTILCLWQATKIWDTSSYTYTPVSAQSVSVAVTGVTKVQTGNPNNSGAWTSASLTNGSITVSVGDTITMLQFS